jgi:hypothetical protein
MKKVFNYFLLGMAVFSTMCFASCSDDDKDSSDNSALVGTWQATTDSIQQTDGTYKLEKTYAAGEYTETYDGKYMVSSDNTEDFSVKLLNNTPVVYTYDASTKTLTVLGIATKVLELTQDKMVIEGEDDTIGFDGKKQTHTIVKTKRVYKRIK